MDRRLLNGIGGIGAIVFGLSTLGNSLQDSMTQYRELQLSRRVAGYVIKGDAPKTNLPMNYRHCGGCGEWIDKKTGKDVEEIVVKRMRKLYASDPKSIEGKNPEDLFDDISARQYRFSLLEVDDQDLNISILVRVYENAKTGELNWNDPNNYLRLTWANSVEERVLADRHIDGIEDRSSQVDYIYFLRVIEKMYQSK